MGPEGPDGPVGPEGPEGPRGLRGLKGNPGDGLPETNSIIGLSWTDQTIYPGVGDPGAFFRLLREEGIAVAFKFPVDLKPWAQAKFPHVVAELQVTPEEQFGAWSRLGRLEILALRDATLQINGDGLIEEFQAGTDLSKSAGLVLKARNNFDLGPPRFPLFRFVLYADSNPET